MIWPRSSVVKADSLRIVSSSASASEAQLADLSDFILEHASNADAGNSPSTITVASTTHRLLHSAEFYEQPRLKGEWHSLGKPAPFMRVQLLIVFSFAAALSGRIVALEGSSAERLERVLPALSLLPETYLDRHIKRKLVSLVYQHKGAINDRVASCFFLHYTKDDLGSSLVS